MTKVWLLATLRDGRCQFEVDSESAMVRGLASLVAEPFSEALPGDVLRFRCSILEESKIESRVTPTRRQGLLALEAAIHAFAEICTTNNPHESS
jgi:cysteine desulfuration protein SufE